MDLKIYHNPRCSKSRQALEILQARGLAPEVVDYLKQPPTLQQIAEIVEKTRLQPAELLRDNEPEYQELGLAGQAIDQPRLYQLLQEHPRLLQRPIVIAGERAVIGRPPERVNEILPE